MKPIEPGCLCLAFEPRMTNAQECVAVSLVKAGDFICLDTVNGQYKCTANHDLWIVDRLLNYSFPIINNNGVPAPFIMRIDGDEEQFKQEQNERVADKLLEVM